MAALCGLLVSIHGIAGLDVTTTFWAFQQPPLYSTPRGLSVSPPALDRSISEVIEQREYSWRMPRENGPPRKGMLASFFEAIFDWWGEVFRTIGRWITKIWDWLLELLPDPAESDEVRSMSRWMNTTHLLLFGLLALVVCAVAILLNRLWARRREQSLEASVEVIPPMADPLGDNVVAAQFPGDEWLAMAWGLLERGESRLALRALYLGSLAYLSERELIMITKSKSDRDYERDLKRRAHTKPDLLTAFAQNRSLFERTWYGMHAVTQEDVTLFTTNLERMKAYA